MCVEMRANYVKLKITLWKNDRGIDFSRDNCWGQDSRVECREKCISHLVV